MFTPFAFVKQEIAVPPVGNLLLDEYPGAAFAHSIRKLRTAYTGDCMQIIRLNDSATLDIGFAGDGYIDTAAIDAFLFPSNNARVSVWYDQSGNGIDFTPKGTIGGFLVTNAGVKYSSNGKFAVYTSNGYQYNMGSDLYTYNGTEYQIAGVSETDPYNGVSNNYGRLFSYKNSSLSTDYNHCNGFIGFYAYPPPFSSRWAVGQNNQFGNNADTAFLANNQYITWGFKEQNTVGAALNNGADATATTGCSTTGLNINRVRYGTDYNNSDSSFIGYIQEVVTWETYTSSDKSGILTNINNFYGAF